jgi:predicted transcriptional regulator
MNKFGKLLRLDITVGQVAKKLLWEKLDIQGNLQMNNTTVSQVTRKMLVDKNLENDALHCGL